MKSIYTLVFLLLAGLSATFAQTGIAIGPSRLYFSVGPGQSQTQRVTISNPSKDYMLELGVSLEDWEYNERGDNVLHPAGTLPSSCAAWISIQEPFFSLAPGERREIEIQLTVPADYQPSMEVPVHTVMLYVTQLNPRDGVDEEGANIRIAVRSGIKLFQRVPGPATPSIDVTDFRYERDEQASTLLLEYVNSGAIWADGAISLELLNQETGAKTTLPETIYYSMPGDRRIQAIPLPANLPPGRYVATAIVDYGDSQSLQIAELEFNR